MRSARPVLPRAAMQGLPGAFAHVAGRAITANADRKQWKGASLWSDLPVVNSRRHLIRTDAGRVTVQNRTFDKRPSHGTRRRAKTSKPARSCSQSWATGTECHSHRNTNSKLCVRVTVLSVVHGVACWTETSWSSPRTTYASWEWPRGPTWTQLRVPDSRPRQPSRCSLSI